MQLHPFSRPAAAAAGLLLLAFAAGLSPAARADAGHDHGATPAAAPSAALPRFAATSDLFELVGVVDGTRLTLYLDHSADNSPVKDAKLELEFGGARIDVKPRADGEFEATLAQPLEPGTVAVTATVAAGAETDLLAGEIVIAAPVQAEALSTPAWRGIAGWSVAGLALLGLLAWLARRTAARRAARAGVAA